ncbi:hypothetical protein MVEN_00876500 [Mycena venus]|uniref:Uncharacterized protein n=1 Tax=Mycena venus TaxID=2733690 RepID=A0A8H6YFY2_9AGAR|nr:hypothetical protein MVEN_00876500 [Mycena venus]
MAADGDALWVLCRVWYANSRSSFSDSPKSRPSPINANEVNPVNRHAYWDQHLRQYTATAREVGVLRDLLHAPTRRGPPLHLIQPTASNYLERAGVLGSESSLYAHVMLHEYPASATSKAWRPLPRQDLREHYAGVLTRFVLGLTFVDTFSTSETPSELQLDAFHWLIRTFFLASRSDNPRRGRRKFDRPLECLLAMDTLKEDGNHMDALLLTPLPSRTHYLIRCTIAWEADLQEEELGVPFETTVDRLARENIERSSYGSPFSIIADIQRWESSIASTTVRPSFTLVSPDSMNITHDGQTLNIPAYRNGLQNALADLSDKLNDILFGFDVPLTMPDSVEDTWSNAERGCSFANNHEFIPPDSFWKHLLYSSQADPTWIGDNRLHFKHASINHVLLLDTYFLRLLDPFIASTCSVARIAEFLDSKIKNSTRERTLFMQLLQLWLVTRCIKWEHHVDHAVFVPFLIPEPIRDLILRYVLIFRPALVKLLRIAGDEQTAILYDEYLWVFNRERISNDAFSELLRQFTADCSRCRPQDPCPSPYSGTDSFTLSSLSMADHPGGEMYCVFLNSTAELDDEEDDLLDQQRGHQRDTAKRMYSIEAGRLPMLASDELLRFRTYCLK